MEMAKGNTEAPPKPSKPAPTKKPPAPSALPTPTPTEALVMAVVPPPPSDVHEKASEVAQSAASHSVYMGPSLLLPQPSRSR